MLQENLTQSMEATCLLGDVPPIEELIYPQDNDPKHTAGAKKNHSFNPEIQNDWIGKPNPRILIQ